MADVLDHHQVMGNKQIGQPQALLQILKRVDNLRLNGYVQRGHRLIAYINSGVTASARAIPCADADRPKTHAHSGGHGRHSAHQLQQFIDTILAFIAVAVQAVDIQASPTMSDTVMRGLSDEYGS